MEYYLRIILGNVESVFKRTVRLELKLNDALLTAGRISFSTETNIYE